MTKLAGSGPDGTITNNDLALMIGEVRGQLATVLPTLVTTDKCKAIRAKAEANGMRAEADDDVVEDAERRRRRFAVKLVLWTAAATAAAGILAACAASFFGLGVIP